MKTLLTAVTLSLTPLFSYAQAPAPAAVENKSYVSMKLEMENAIKTGNAYLKTQQTKDGYWKDETIPAYTSLAITATMRDPNLGKETPANIKSAYTWLLKQQKRNGSIFGKGLATYNTATGIMALAASGDPKHVQPILRARAFLISQQSDFDRNPDMKNMVGGIGYGGTYKHSDMSNTYLALEALKLSDHIAKDSDNGKQPELDFKAAIAFVSRCQNLEKTNNLENVGNDGSFVYFPGNSKAGMQKNADGTKSLRGTGSISYAGLLSLIYADVDQDDPRIIAVKDWLNKNYTLKENPGLGQQGLYYYYHAMAKALTAANIDTLTTKDGKKIDWRKDLATVILSTQREDGSWVNKNARWWENQPELVTCYAVLTLEQIHASIAK